MQIKDTPGYYIIRWSDAVTFPSGNITNMACASGTYEEVQAYAERIAKEHNVEIEAII